jgi:hypothetical protein
MGALRTMILGTFLTASTAALADPTALICSLDGRPDLPPTTIDLNEAASTATVNHPAGTYSAGSSSGPLAAKFDPQTVTFDDKLNATYSHYTIDRVTGILIIYIGAGTPWDQAAPQDRYTQQYACHVGQKQF